MKDIITIHMSSMNDLHKAYEEAMDEFQDQQEDNVQYENYSIKLLHIEYMRKPLDVYNKMYMAVFEVSDEY